MYIEKVYFDELYHDGYEIKMDFYAMFYSRWDLI